MFRKIAFLWLILVFTISVFPDGCRFLIVSIEEFAPHLEEFAQLKTKMGYKTEIFIPSDPENSAITKTEIDSIYSYPTNELEYLLLVGIEDVLSMGNVSGDQTDCYYCDFDGDHMNDIYPARWPARNIEDVQGIVDKTIKYTTDPYIDESADWLLRGSLAVNPDGSSGDIEYWRCVFHAGSLLVDAGFTHIDTFSTDPPSSDGGIEITEAIDEGRGYMIYRGQGVENWWGYHFNPDDFSNGHMTPIVSGTTCKTLGSFGPAWLNSGTYPNVKGAILYMGTNTVSGGYTLMLQRNAMALGFIDGLFAGMSAARATELGRQYILEIPDPTSHREYNSCMMQGDPTLMMWTSLPKEISAIHNEFYSDGESHFDILVESEDSGPLDSALCCIIIGDDVYEYGYTNDYGELSIPYVFPTGGDYDTMRLTITAHNHLPYHADILMMPEGPFPYITSHWFCDTATGNSDGFLSRGENIEIKFWLQNYGPIDAENVELILRSSSGFCDITDSTYEISILATEESLLITDSFYFTVTPDAEFSRKIDFEIQISHTEDTDTIIRYYRFFSPKILGTALEMTDYIFDDAPPGGNGNGVFEWGENITLQLELANNGETVITDINSHISLPPFLSNVDPIIKLKRLESYDTVLTEPMFISTSPLIDEAMALNTNPMIIYSNGGYSVDTMYQVLRFDIEKSSTGPDDYGYYIYDSYDFGNALRPEYEWNDISEYPDAYNAGLSENHFYLDIEDIPFDFQFYGIDFEEMGLSNKGYVQIDYGHTVHLIPHSFPSSSAPEYILAGAWDDYDPSLSGEIYAKYLPDAGKFIIQYDDISFIGGVQKSFQIVLTDIESYPTETGDNEIFCYYKNFTPEDLTVIGLQGFEMGYLNYLHGDMAYAGANIPNDSFAIRITTQESMPTNSEWLVAEEFLISDEEHGNGNGIIEDGEQVEITMELINNGNLNADDVMASVFLNNRESDAEIIDSVDFYGDIALGAVAGGDGGFSILIEDSDEQIILDFIVKSSSGYRNTAHFVLNSNLSHSIEEASMPNSVSLSKVYPNPFNSAFTLEVETRSLFRVYDIEGRLIIEDEVSSAKSYRIDSKSSGIYLYSIMDMQSRQRKTGKLVFIK